MPPQLLPQRVRAYYELGWFVMEDEETGDLDWYSTTHRALFPIEGVHVSRSLRRRIRRGEFQVTFDRAFDQVIEGCLRPGDNWIGPAIRHCFNQIHEQGWGHSVECWQDGRLVGGLYGVQVGGVFSAESMFHRVTDASKVALWAAVAQARECGYVCFDAQVMNPHLARMGAYEMHQTRYLRLLKDNLHVVPKPWGESPYS